MMEEFYTLQWRGRQTEPMSLDVIREALETGDIHSMYQIDDRGRWRLLRDFLEDHPVAKEAPPSYGAASAAYEPPAWEPAYAPVPPPLPAYAPAAAETRHGGDFGAYADASFAAASLPAGHATPHRASAQGLSSGKFPRWLTGTLIALLMVILPAGVIGAYLLLRPAALVASASTAPANAPVTPATAANPAAEGETKGASAAPADTPKENPEGDLTVEELMERKGRFVVQVESHWEEMASTGVVQEGGSLGSGVHLRNEKGYAIFVTNRHVIQPPKKARNINYSILFEGKPVPCEILAVAKYGVDLAKIRIKHDKGEEGDVLMMVTIHSLKIGQECVAIGNALGIGISVTDGIISRFDEDRGCRFIRTSAPISGGNSGGGLFRKKDGALIGITTASLEGEGIQNLNLVIPVDYILSELFWETLP